MDVSCIAPSNQNARSSSPPQSINHSQSPCPAAIPRIPHKRSVGVCVISLDQILTFTANMDRQTVYSLDLWGEKSEQNDGQESNRQVQTKLVDFILSFAVDNAFIYRYVWPQEISFIKPLLTSSPATKYGKTSCQISTFAMWTSATSSSTTKSLRKSSTTSLPTTSLWYERTSLLRPHLQC